MTKNDVSLRDQIERMSTAARADGKLLSVSDIRYITAGIPDVIADDYLYFAEGIEIGKTGKLGGKPEEWEALALGGKIIRTESIISVEMTRKP